MDKKTKKVVKEKNPSKILIIIIIVFFLVYFAMYIGIGNHQRAVLHKNLKDKEVEIKDYEVDVKKIEVRDSRVTEAMKGFNSFKLGQRVYGLDHFVLEDLTRYDYVVAAIMNVESDKINYCVSPEMELSNPVNLAYLNERLKIVADAEITMDDIINNSVDNGLTVGEYFFDNFALHFVGEDIYIIGPCDGDMNNEAPMFTQVVRAETFADYLNVYQRVGFAELTYYGKYDVYNNIERKGTALEMIEANEQPNFAYKYPTYKITFIKVGDHYYFQSMENRL